MRLNVYRCVFFVYVQMGKYSKGQKSKEKSSRVFKNIERESYNSTWWDGKIPGE